MWQKTFFLLVLLLLSSHAFAQESQVNQANAVGYINCPTGQQYVYLYQSLSTFEVMASPRCEDRIEILGREDTLGGYLRVRTADGKEGYVPQSHVKATAPARSRITIQEQTQPVPAGQAPLSAGPLSSPRSNFASDVPLAEFFGGYSYLNADWEGLASRSGIHGWNASGAFNVNRWLGVEADVSGHYTRNCLGAVGLNCTTLSFMGGPKITYRDGRIVAFGHGLFGVGNLSASLVGGSLSWRELAWAAGGGVEYAATELISIRLGQVDYLRTQFLQSLGGTYQNNIRVSAGVVFKLGRIITE